MLSSISLKRFLWPLYLAPGLLFSQDFMVELRAGYFYPISSTVREIYHSGGGEYEIQASARVYDNFNVWANFNVFFRSGQSLGLDYKTSIRIFPLSAGINYSFHLLDCFHFYLGVGPSYTWVGIHDHSPYVREHISKQAWGAVGKAGFLYFFPRNPIFLDIYTDYYYTRISAIHQEGVESSHRDVGGLRVGGGIGIAF